MISHPRLFCGKGIGRIKTPTVVGNLLLLSAALVFAGPSGSSSDRY
jgi:hypothetical protein